MSQVNSEMRALRELKNQYMSSHSVANSQKALLQSRYQKVGRDVKALLTAYSKVSKDYSTQYREKLKKQYRIANPSATEEEVDEAVYNDDAHQAFAQA
ncbi:Plasma membrane t-SNARE, secretory vesicle fusion, partial [Coemansia sp. RSA 1287]